jgi:hypothetical protein
MYIRDMYLYIQLILLFSGFRGTHRPPAPPTHGLSCSGLISWLSWQGARLELWKSTQHSAQSARDCYVGLVWKHFLPRAGAHINIIKSVAHLTNNKDMFLSSFAFCAITAAVGCCSSTNRCWKTRLGRVRLAQYNWIELEILGWNRPWMVTEISAFPANRCAPSFSSGHDEQGNLHLRYSVRFHIRCIWHYMLSINYTNSLICYLNLFDITSKICWYKGICWLYHIYILCILLVYIYFVYVMYMHCTY